MSFTLKVIEVHSSIHLEIELILQHLELSELLLKSHPYKKELAIAIGTSFFRYSPCTVPNKLGLKLK